MFRRAILWTMAALLIWAAAPHRTVRAQQTHPPAAELLPPETVLLLSVVDAPLLRERLGNTSLGRMSRDPQLQPLVDQLYGSLATAVDAVHDQVGLSLDELLAIPQGELTVALVTPAERRPAVVILIDAGSQLPNVRKLAQRAQEMMAQGGATRSEETVAGSPCVGLAVQGRQDRAIWFCEKDATQLVCSDRGVLEGMLKVWNGESAVTLSENEHYAAVMTRCRGAQGEEPQFIWYFDPISLVRTIGQSNTQAQVAVAILPALGLDGLRGMGGSLALDAGRYDFIAHAHFLMDNPRAGILKMIAFDSGDMTPEHWVPADVSGYVTLRWKFDTTFETLVTLYDSFRGQGAFDKLLSDQVLGPTGLNFRADILPALGGRVTFIHRVQEPIAVGSLSMGFALQLKDPELMKRTLAKATQEHAEFFTEAGYGGQSYWRVTPPRAGENGEETGSNRREGCFGVLGDYLILCDRPALYDQVILTAAGSAEKLADALDFKVIASKIRRQSGGSQPALVHFDRPEEGFRVLYGLATGDATRERLRARAENNPFLQSVNDALEQNPLPPFAVLQQYLAPRGGMIVDDETGIHYLGFGLKRQE